MGFKCESLVTSCFMNVLLIGSFVKSSFYGGANFNNLGLLSIASNLDPGHKVKVLDCFRSEETLNVRQIIDDFQPRVIGLTAMTYQYEGARNFAAEIRKRYKDIIIVLGGYHATALYKEILDSEDKVFFDYIIRREGEHAFNKLLQAIEGHCEFRDVPNLSYIKDGIAIHNDTIESSDLSDIKLPDRRLISNNDYSTSSSLIESPEVMICIETSRGCIHNCHFCCIKQMYAKPYRAYSLDRVIEDLKNIKQFQPKVTAVFIVDDNITADPERFEKLCDLIIENKLNTFTFFAQCSSIGLSSSEKLIVKMKEAGFAWVFIGIDNNNKENLRYMGKGNILSRTETACKYLKKHGILIAGGMIVGCPDDDKESVKSAFRYLKKIGCIVAATQFITPYPKTALREDYLKRNLIDNVDDYIYYDGMFCNTHTKHLSSMGLYKIVAIEHLKYYLFSQRKGFIEVKRYKKTFPQFIHLLKLHFFYCLTLFIGTGDKIESNLIKRKSDARKKSEAFRFFAN